MKIYFVDLRFNNEKDFFVNAVNDDEAISRAAQLVLAEDDELVRVYTKLSTSSKIVYQKEEAR